MAKEIKKENEAVLNGLSRTEEFLSTHKKSILTIVTMIIVIAAGCFGYYKLSYLPGKAKVEKEMASIEEVFRNGNFEVALHGDGNILGFERIIAENGNKVGQDIYLYAAICEMNLTTTDSLGVQTPAPEPEKALKYLDKYKTDDPIFSARAESLKGDAYIQLGDYAKAAGMYEAAAAVANNVFTADYLFKAGTAYEALGDYAKALEKYRSVKYLYPDSVISTFIDQYITRLEVK